jgi:hypothetical protein
MEQISDGRNAPGGSGACGSPSYRCCFRENLRYRKQGKQKAGRSRYFGGECIHFHEPKNPHSFTIIHAILIWGWIWLYGQELSLSVSQEDIYLTREGRIAFISEAPLELIEASSNQLQGALDTEKTCLKHP